MTNSFEWKCSTRGCRNQWLQNGRGHWCFVCGFHDGRCTDLESRMFANFLFFARKKNIFLRALQRFFARCNTVPPQPIALVPLNRRFSVFSLLFGIGVVADLSSVSGKSVWWCVFILFGMGLRWFWRDDSSFWHAARAKIVLPPWRGVFLSFPLLFFLGIFRVVIVVKGKTFMLMEMLSWGCACISMMMWVWDAAAASCYFFSLRFPSVSWSSSVFF